MLTSQENQVVLKSQENLMLVKKKHFEKGEGKFYKNILYPSLLSKWKEAFYDFEQDTLHMST